MVEAVLLKPLDGKAIGEIVEYSQADFDALVAMNAVAAKPKEKAKK